MRLFCHHIWKRVSTELIDEYSTSSRGVPLFDVEIYLLTYECVKCKKTELKQWITKKLSKWEDE